MLNASCPGKNLFAQSNCEHCEKAKPIEDSNKSYINQEFIMMREFIFEKYWETRSIHCSLPQSYKTHVKAYFMQISSAAVITQFINHSVAFQASLAVLDKQINQEEKKNAN